MKTKYFKQIFSLGCLAAALTALPAGCGKSEIDNYGSKDKLWFTQQVQVNKQEIKNVANIVRSFSMYPGSATIEVPFEVNLIGNKADRDRTYKIVVVDTLTTADPSEYEIKSTILPANSIKGNCVVVLKKSARMATEEVKLTLYMVENEAFEPGYYYGLKVSVKFNDITTQPEWWTADIEKSYFGPFSKAKFDAFYAYSGLNDIAGLEKSDLRKLLLGFKEYIIENNITEDDEEKSPMIIPVY